MKFSKQTKNVYRAPKKTFREKMIAVYHYRWFYLMFLPVFLSLLVFHYFPIYGIKYAFTDYTPFKEPTCGGSSGLSGVLSSV